MAENYPNGLKNTLGKGEIAHFEQFFLFSECFQMIPFLRVFSNDLYCRHVKTRACLGKG